MIDDTPFLPLDLPATAPAGPKVTAACGECGKSFTYHRPHGRRGRDRLICSAACRQARLRRQSRSFDCAICAATFAAVHARLTCSPVCAATLRARTAAATAAARGR